MMKWHVHLSWELKFFGIECEMSEKMQGESRRWNLQCVRDYFLIKPTFACNWNFEWKWDKRFDKRDIQNQTLP